MTFSKTVFIVRGMPGSGKSTYIAERWRGIMPACLNPLFSAPGVVVSGDHFFTDWGTGEYFFDGKKLGQAHTEGRLNLLRACKGGVPVVVVDNTHSRRWEYAEAIEMAKIFGYRTEVIDLYDGGCSDEELFARNVHDVPIEVIATHRARWEKEPEA